MSVIKVEDKLYQNRYIVDENRPHIQIKDADPPCQ
jgi:ferredoxin like protein